MKNWKKKLFKMFTQNILKINPIFSIFKRNVKKYNWYNEGIAYPGFKYYPRNPETFKDPPYEPTKLFRVKRTKKMKDLLPVERIILVGFKLDGKLDDYAIIKNIPENNGRLWKIKHLIQIQPITFPDGFPSETDRTVLKENGELRIIKNVSNVEKSLQLSEGFQKLPERMDGDTLRRNLRKKWLSGYQNYL